MEIKPYYEKNGMIIYNGDCFEVMKQFDDKSFDLVLTSPPYNMRTRICNDKYTTIGKSENFSKKYSYFSDDLPIDKYFKFHKETIRYMMNISRTVFINFQIVSGSKEAWFSLIGEFNKNIKDIIVWDKGFGQPAMHSSVMNRGYELILILEEPANLGRSFTNSTFKRGEMQDIWRVGRGGKGNFKGHSALFPETLVYKVINNWKSDCVLDPFMGTGTTLVVARKLGKRAVGIEISKEYCDIAIDRLNEILL